MLENSKLKPGKNMLCAEIITALRTIFVHNMFSPCSAKRRASDKDLPVTIGNFDHAFAWKKQKKRNTC